MSCKDKFFGTVATIFFLAVVTITAMRLAIFDLRGSADMTVAIVTFMNCGKIQWNFSTMVTFREA